MRIGTNVESTSCPGSENRVNPTRAPSESLAVNISPTPGTSSKARMIMLASDGTRLKSPPTSAAAAGPGKKYKLSIIRNDAMAEISMCRLYLLT